MNLHRITPTLAVLAMFAASTASSSPSWNLVLPDTVVLGNDVATLGDVAQGPVPARARDLVIRSGLSPNAVVDVSRQDILRRLVTAGLAGGVRMSGAERSHLVFMGSDLAIGDLQREVRLAVQDLVPPADPGAPDSWFEMDMPALKLSAADHWKVTAERAEPLAPGRNLVRMRVDEGGRVENFPVTVTLHKFGEIALIRNSLDRNRPLTEKMFDWQWRDLALVDKGLTVHRSSIRGASPTRKLRAGEYLRQADLKETPVILAGDAVELQVMRGQVMVAVRAVARQNGCLGQTIPVRSELTGRLVNARVAGPGLVEWRN